MSNYKYYIVKCNHILENNTFYGATKNVILKVSGDYWGGTVLSRSVIIKLAKKEEIFVGLMLNKNEPCLSHIRDESDWGKFWEATRKYIVRNNL